MIERIVGNVALQQPTKLDRRFRRSGPINFCVLHLVGLIAGVGARASISTTIIVPGFTQPGDSLSVTTLVVNTGQTLAGLTVDQQLPGPAFQYVPGSLNIRISDGTVITNESEVLTDTGGTNLLFDFTRIQTASALTNLVISEVFPGSITTFLPTDPVSFQWFEIYNPSANPI